MSIGSFIVGMIFVGIGFMATWKTEWLMMNFGRIGFAEKHLGSEGGSRLMYKIIGVIIIIGGLLYATSLLDNLLGWTLGGVMPGN